jgi:hypothetical protein
MTEAQRNRLEAYIRSNLQKKTMKKVMMKLSFHSSQQLLHSQPYPLLQHQGVACRW